MTRPRLLMASMALLLAASPAAAYIRSTLSTTDATPIRWDLDETQQSQTNVVGGEIIYTIDTAGSQNIPGTADADAIVRAFQHWEGIGTSRAAFVRGTDQAIQAANNDGINAVYFAEGVRTPIGGVNTNVDGFISLTPVFSTTAGANKGLILDANIILNGRQFTWTVTPDSVPASFDVESVVTHEVGHFIGLDHSGVLNATMAPRYLPGEARQRTLESDDIAGASAVYPDGNFATNGTISGLVGRPTPVFGALVAVEDPEGRVLEESITASNGSYAAPGLTSNDYNVYVEPVDKTPPTTTNFFDETDLGGVYGATVDPNFFASLPLLTTVTAPSATTRSFSVGSSAPAINITKIGARASTLPSVVFRNAPTFVFAGDNNVFVGVAGPNITTGAVFEITGTGITDNGLASNGTVDGEPYVIHSISVSPTADAGLRTFRVTSGALGRTYATGGLEVYPNVSMSLAAPGLFLVVPGEVNTGRLPGQNPLTLTRRGDDIDLEWDDEPGAYGYNVYRGTIASLASGVYDHQAIAGTVNGKCGVTTSYTALPGEALDNNGTYYLVSAWNNAGEGIVGRDSANNTQPPASPACPAP